ncbi:MAG: hypothetical protein NTW19_15020 [Planctomycetota bacterium]|nr:hypothetical protein [Planctomycetota bacterium]
MPTHTSLNLLPILPASIIALVAIGLFALLAHGCLVLLRKQVPPRWVAILAAVRVGIVLVFLLALLQPIASYALSSKLLPDLLVLVDTSRSMGPATSATGEAVGGKTRLDEAVATLREGKLIPELRKSYNVHYFAVDRTATPVDDEGLAKLKPVGDTTRFSDSLTSAWDFQRQAAASNTGVEMRPQRAILLSDGNDLGSTDLVETARELGVAVDVLPPGDAGPGRTPARVVIASVQSPRRVLLGSETRIAVTLRREGTPDSAMAVTLVEGGKTIATQDVAFDKGQTEQLVVVAHRPSEAGIKQYELRLAPKAALQAPAPSAAKTPAKTPAQTQADKEKENAGPLPYRFSVQVLDARNETLILQDVWRWDFKFIRRVFEDDPSFAFTAMLTRGGATYVQYAEADSHLRLSGFPQSRTELGWFDTLYLVDPNIRRWPKGLPSAVAGLVRDEGKSLVVLAGPNIGQWMENPELATLLPVELSPDTATPVPGPIDVHLTADGASSPFFINPTAAKAAPPPAPAPGTPGAPAAAAGASGASGAADLPPLDQIYPVLRKRPAATILLEASKHANTYGPIIIMAEQTVGRGRVLFVGTDTLWKWHTLGEPNDAGLTPFAVFWQQAFRALAPARPTPGGVTLNLQPQRTRYEAGQRVSLSAQILSDRLLPEPRIQATVTLPDETQIPLAFAPDPAKPSSYRADFEAAGPGQYRVNALLTAEGKTAADMLVALDVDQPRSELATAGVDRDALARIASMTGGRVINPTDATTWPTKDNPQPLTIARTHSLDLWGNFTLLLLLAALLTADWTIRLIRGYT